MCSYKRVYLSLYFGRLTAKFDMLQKIVTVIMNVKKNFHDWLTN